MNAQWLHSCIRKILHFICFWSMTAICRFLHLSIDKQLCVSKWNNYSSPLCFQLSLPQTRCFCSSGWPRGMETAPGNTLCLAVSIPSCTAFLFSECCMKILNKHRLYASLLTSDLSPGWSQINHPELNKVN